MSKQFHITKSSKNWLVPSALLLAACGSHAADLSLVAGWDFSQYPLSGANTIDLATFTGSVNANYSDFNNPTADVSPFYGTLYYDGQFGSTAVAYADFNPLAAVQPVSGSLLSARKQLADGLELSSISNKTLLLDSGQQEWSISQLLLRADVSIVLMADARLPAGSWTILFAAQDNDDGVQLTWEVSTDGAAYTPVVGTTEVTTSDQAYSVTFPQLQGASKVFIRATFTGVSGQLGKFMTLDNVGIRADLDPPAGSFWSASPVIVGGWRDSGAGYPDEAGIGLIEDSHWPWVFVNDPQGGGSWVWFDQTISTRLQFYAYIPDGDYWIMGLGDVGWYYSWEPGNSGWFKID